jgi:hypothetical protein
MVRPDCCWQHLLLPLLRLPLLLPLLPLLAVVD